jgi:hypothetical protein
LATGGRLTVDLMVGAGMETGLPTDGLQLGSWHELLDKQIELRYRRRSMHSIAATTGEGSAR